MNVGPAKLWCLSCVAYRRKRIRLAKALKLLNYLLFKCLLPFEAQVSEDLELSHYGLAVVVHPNTTIGRRVRIYHHVTLAAETWIGSPHRIYVEDDVVIGAGAIIIGSGNRSLTIGRGAKVGAGAVVTKDVAAGATVVGVPAGEIADRPPSSLFR